jgi:hypothetical protein
MATDLTETTIDTGLTMVLDEWAGGEVHLDDVPAKSYIIVSNTVAGVVTVRSDSTMSTDYGAGSDDGFYLTLDHDAYYVGALIGEAEITDADAFSMEVYVNGDMVKRWPNLSIDPTSRYYFPNIINDDTSNYEITATDLASPPTPGDKFAVPANEVGEIAVLTATVLTTTLHQVRIESPVAGADPTVALGTTSDLMKYRNIIKCVVDAGATTATVTSTDMYGGVVALGQATLGALFTPNTPIMPPFTITNGGTALVQDDIVWIDYFPFVPDELIGSYVIPDWDDTPLNKYLIVDNDHKTITVGAGQDMTTVGTVGDDFVVQTVSKLRGGDDGISGVDTADYTPHFDIATSGFNELLEQNKGLVKLGCPGKTTTAIVKDMAAYAEAKNWQARYEIPSATQDEVGAINQINTTYGRNDFAVVSMPSFGYIDNPNAPDTLKLVSLTGQIHGREALVAKNYDGYHKAAAGVEVTLPSVLKLDATELNEELLTPVGINVVKKKKGNFILWGDKTVAIDPAWKWKHQRELMSHYENRLREGYDFIIFAINSKTNWALLLTSLRAFFLPEFAKEAVRGDDFSDAVQIKIDEDINTDATMAAGELNCEIKLQLADTVHQFIITVGKQGIFEQVA